ncbi:MAG: hypothetical protein KJO76_08560 [Gammaproteobacteria bacterium]|nr:hypothetical protein [Gammaproteobacteria bacterium]MBT8444729.1 hypothetical protein [Gammaproteobacteria bacterium]NND37420.1 hypothetical protein [Gammaproteobacteria bacterium]
MQADQIAIGAFIGGLAAFAVKGLVDLLFHHFGGRSAQDPKEMLADAAWREIDRVRLRQRSCLYEQFDDKLHTAVHEMSQGWNRMSLVYAARDKFVALKRLAPDTVVDAARAMCDVCVEMMQYGYSDVLHNRFHRAQIEFRQACSEDLKRPRATADEDEHRSTKARRQRKYISPYS